MAQAPRNSVKQRSKRDFPKKWNSKKALRDKEARDLQKKTQKFRGGE